MGGEGWGVHRVEGRSGGVHRVEGEGWRSTQSRGGGVEEYTE